MSRSGSFSSRMASKDLFDDQRRETERRLVEQQQRAAGPSAPGRSPASAARRRTACRRAGRCAASGAGTECSMRSRSSVELRQDRATSGAHLQVFHYRHAREDAAAFRRLGDARAGRSRGSACWVMSRPSKSIMPSRARGLPKMVIIKRRLAGAVGADQRDDLAFLDVQIDALKRR